MNERKWRVKLPKKFLVPLCILLLAAIIGGIWYFAGTEKYEDWQPTEAVVTDIEPYSKRKGGSSHRYFYEYSVDGVTYSGSELFTTKEIFYNIGDIIQVWYDPDEASRSAMTTNVDLNFIGPFFLAIPLMLGAYSTFSRKPANKSQE